VTKAGIPYATGGVGDTEQSYIESHFGDYSFKLVNAGNGAYVSEVNVTLENEQGETVLETTTNGPWLVVDLPAGRYRLTASFKDQRQSDEVVVTKAASRRLVLRWNASME